MNHWKFSQGSSLSYPDTRFEPILSKERNDIEEIFDDTDSERFFSKYGQKNYWERRALSFFVLTTIGLTLVLIFKRQSDIQCGIQNSIYCKFDFVFDLYMYAVYISKAYSSNQRSN